MPPERPMPLGEVPPPAATGLPLSERGLFIIGAARSGTTVLQNALNDSPDIFLFGEPNFHEDGEAPGFAGRYNAMHRGWANQETKSSFCPAVLATDGTWRDYLAAMSAHYRYVGAKLVINPVRAPDGLDRLFDFHCRHFYRSRYLFTFRDPLATIASTRDLQLLVRGENDDLRLILASYAETACLYIRMLRNLPYVGAVFHDTVDRTTFDALEQWLGVPLAGSHRYYQPAKVRDYAGAAGSLGHAGTLAALRAVYEALRQEAAAEFRALQAEQNDNHLDGGHFTAIGRLQRELRRILGELSRA